MLRLTTLAGRRMLSRSFPVQHAARRLSLLCSLEESPEFLEWRRRQTPPPVKRSRTHIVKALRQTAPYLLVLCACVFALYHTPKLPSLSVPSPASLSGSLQPRAARQEEQQAAFQPGWEVGQQSRPASQHLQQDSLAPTEPTTRSVTAESATAPVKVQAAAASPAVQQPTQVQSPPRLRTSIQDLITRPGAQSAPSLPPLPQQASSGSAATAEKGDWLDNFLSNVAQLQLYLSRRVQPYVSRFKQLDASSLSAIAATSSLLLLTVLISRWLPSTKVCCNPLLHKLCIVGVVLRLHTPRQLSLSLFVLRSEY